MKTSASYNLITLIFSAWSVLAVCGCGDDTTARESAAGKESNLPAKMQRLLPKEIATLAKSVQAAGGRTVLRPESDLVQVRFEGGKFGDAELASLEQLEFATAFNAPSAQITDEGLEQLASVGQRIKTLDLTGNPITDAGLAHLQQMTELEFVFLDKTQVTAAGVEELQSAMPELKVGFLQ